MENDDEEVGKYMKIVLKKTPVGQHFEEKLPTFSSIISKNFPVVITELTKSKTEYSFVVTTATDKTTHLRSIHPVTGNRKFGVKEENSSNLHV